VRLRQREEGEDPTVMTRARALRLSLGLRSSEAADQAGLERWEISRIENGEPDSRPSLNLLAHLYKVPVDTMLDKVRLKIIRVYNRKNKEPQGNLP
jgi:transcriptional regulator with XRE-family HTH domain